MPEPGSIDTGGGAYVGGDIHAGGDVVLRDQITINYGNLSAEDIRERQKQEKLLRNVEDFWVTGVLEKSLFHQVLLQLNREAAQDLVPSPWSTVINLPDQNPSTVQGASLLPAFEQSNDSLLISGEGGSGKTTMLIQLAAELCDQAWRDPAKPIPVILHLSTWGRKHTNLVKWAAEEINHFYKVPHQLGERWIAQDSLILLLDGLDEVPAERRKACVEEINAFRDQHGLTGMVVCTRLEEYKALGMLLKLNGAVVIQPLDDDQVQAYLAGPDPALRVLSGAVRQDPALGELAKTPLMLSVLVLAYQGAPVETLQLEGKNIDTWRGQLIDTYIRRMFERRGTRYQGQEPALLKKISHIARKLGESSQSVFFIENLHPGWLVSAFTRLIYYFITRLIIFSIIGLALYAVLALSGDDPVPGGILVLLGPPWILSALVRWGLSLVRKNMLPPRLENLLSPNVEAVAFGLSIPIFFALIASSDPSIWNPVYIFTFLSFTVLLTIVMRYILPRSELADDIRVVESMQWSWKSFIRGMLMGAAAGILFSIGMAIAFPDTVDTSSISDIGLSLELAFFVFVLPLAAIFGLASGLRGKRIEGKFRLNQGIYQSARNMGLSTLFLATGGAVIGTAIALYIRRAGVEVDLLDAVLLISLPLMAAGALRNGALTLIQHYTLRLALWIERTLPLNLAGLLDTASDLLLMRRTGGGYMFIHRIFMEHFQRTPDHP